MAKPLIQELQKHRLLLISFVVSLILLIVFFIFQGLELKILNLDIKWILLSGVPILIGLFIGGYIKKFKGFGFELESNLKEPIPKSLILDNDVTESFALNKQSLDQLRHLSSSKKSKVDRLTFTTGRIGYYNLFVIQEYVSALKHLKFIEIVDNEGKFLYLVPISELKIQNGFNSDRLSELINAIEMRNFTNNFPNVVKDFILITDNIIESYKKINNSQQRGRLFINEEALPILDTNNIMVGIVYKRILEKRIIDEVLVHIG